MRKVKVEETEFAVRPLRRKEMEEKGLAEYGIKPFFYKPPTLDDGAAEADKMVDVDKVVAGQKLVLDLAVEGGLDAVDAVGGNPAINKVYDAIIAETYGLKGEEKNLPRSGQDDQTQTE